ncbi:SGNH/GDSL hydrolase family protein [Neomoorella mulderi]|uniref:Arylesterase n=1 Tax=Moorella mulderi DSM 14980 TaxID=1122241 RepID=A0A151AXC7_9FIRM|nr:SGNH/GDSL hydrolase family protein [Moorella mulderi]KYH32314.1 arylesterase precursor [Moorella mulderi DSM 14980]
MCNLPVDLVGMGDSLTWGYPFGPEASWLELAARETGLVVVNRGISGETTGEMLARFDEDVIRLKPRAVTIMGGTNDAWAGFTVTEVIDNVRAMVDKALRAGIQPVMALPPPLCQTGSDIPVPFLEKMAGLLEAYREACRDLALSRGIKLLDFYTPLLDPATGWGKREYFVDDAHPSRRGYQVMAGVAIDLFRKLTQQANRPVLHRK